MGTPKPLLRTSRILLGLLELFIAIGGIAGGVGLVLDTSGVNLGFTTMQLARSPFQDYLAPGLILLFLIGLGNLIGSVSAFLRYRYTGELALFLGGFLALWIIVQIFWLGFASWLQPIYLLIGCVEMLLGWRIIKGKPRQIPNKDNEAN
jgi:hypothetical protein